MTLKVLTACEYSGIVRDAFENAGADAWSCDLLPTESEQTIKSGKHHQGDILEYLEEHAHEFDLMIAFPPCTFLSYAGTRHWNNPGRCQKRLEALDFFRKLWEQPIEKICIENPAGCASPTIAKYTQHIEPYFFGDAYRKRTWLWLKNLPPLEKTNEVKPVGYFVSCSNPKDKNYKQPLLGHHDQKQRSKFHPGIAAAMAEQWIKS